LSIHVDLTMQDDRDHRTGCDLAVIVPFNPGATISELIDKGLAGAREQLSAASQAEAEEWARLQRESLEFKPLTF
jgi:hypothetical protein